MGEVTTVRIATVQEIRSPVLELLGVRMCWVGCGDWHSRIMMSAEEMVEAIVFANGAEVADKLVGEAQKVPMAETNAMVIAKMEAAVDDSVDISRWKIIPCKERFQEKQHDHLHVCDSRAKFNTEGRRPPAPIVLCVNEALQLALQTEDCTPQQAIKLFLAMREHGLEYWPETGHTGPTGHCYLHDGTYVSVSRRR